MRFFVGSGSLELLCCLARSRFLRSLPFLSQSPDAACATRRQHSCKRLVQCERRRLLLCASGVGRDRGGYKEHDRSDTDSRYAWSSFRPQTGTGSRNGTVFLENACSLGLRVVRLRVFCLLRQHCLVLLALLELHWQKGAFRTASSYSPRFGVQNWCSVLNAIPACRQSSASGLPSVFII
jgi:hypothetical protein